MPTEVRCKGGELGVQIETPSFHVRQELPKAKKRSRGK
jgi:hypothetical protein